jgi:uncharacterized C2H2 Zn-finger protein
MARARTNTSSDQVLTCPECGRTFTRAAALGAHRRAAHGVAGASRQTRSNRRRARQASSTTNAKPPSAAARRQTRTPRNAAATSDGRRGTRTVTVERDRLLKTLFPSGIPASEEIIRAINSWLDDAERLAQMK